jgi:hypothetical protein
MEEAFRVSAREAAELTLRGVSEWPFRPGGLDTALERAA